MIILLENEREPCKTFGGGVIQGGACKHIFSHGLLDFNSWVVFRIELEAKRNYAVALILGGTPSRPRAPQGGTPSHMHPTTDVPFEELHIILKRHQI